MPQQRKKNGEPTVRQDKLSKQNVILYLCGIIPVVWLGLLIAPCLKDGLPGLVQQFGSVMQNPFQIQLCEDSVKTAVSYTHLDVYKRQGLMRERKERERT